MKRWRVFRCPDQNEVLFWWPYSEDYPNHPSGLAFEMVIAIEFPTLRAMWTLQHNLHHTDEPRPPFIVEYNPEEGFIKIDGIKYGWVLEEDFAYEPEQDTEVILPEDEVLHEEAMLVGGKIPAHIPGAYPNLSCCGGTKVILVPDEKI